MTQFTSAGKPINRQGGSFASMTAIAAATATTHVAAASNVNGLWLRAAAVGSGGLNTLMVLCTGAAAPTSTTSNASLLPSVEVSHFEQLVSEIFIPAGQGLYSFNTTAGGVVFASWDLG